MDDVRIVHAGGSGELPCGGNSGGATGLLLFSIAGGLQIAQFTHPARESPLLLEKAWSVKCLRTDLHIGCGILLLELAYFEFWRRVPDLGEARIPLVDASRKECKQEEQQQFSTQSRVHCRWADNQSGRRSFRESRPKCPGKTGGGLGDGLMVMDRPSPDAGVRTGL